MHKLVLIHRLNLCSRSGMRNLFKMHAQASCIMQMHSHVEHRAHQNATTTSDHRDVIIATCQSHHCNNLGISWLPAVGTMRTENEVLYLFFGDGCRWIHNTCIIDAFAACATKKKGRTFLSAAFLPYSNAIIHHYSRCSSSRNSSASIIICCSSHSLASASWSSCVIVKLNVLSMLQCNVVCCFCNSKSIFISLGVATWACMLHL